MSAPPDLASLKAAIDQAELHDNVVFSGALFAADFDGRWRGEEVREALAVVVNAAPAIIAKLERIGDMLCVVNDIEQNEPEDMLRCFMLAKNAEIDRLQVKLRGTELALSSSHAEIERLRGEQQGIDKVILFANELG